MQIEKPVTVLSRSDHVGRLPLGRELVSRVGWESEAQGFQCQPPCDPPGASNGTTQDAPVSTQILGQEVGCGEGKLPNNEGQGCGHDTLQWAREGEGGPHIPGRGWGQGSEGSLCPSLLVGLEHLALNAGCREPASPRAQPRYQASFCRVGRMFRRPQNWPKAAVGRDSAFWQRALVG